jgi:hypothetical protein
MAQRPLAIILPPGVDPPGLDRAPPAPAIFDARPHRNRGTRGITRSTPEWDNRLIATAVALGCPRHIAEQVRHHPARRYEMLELWCDVQDAAEGHRAARERVDRKRVAFATSARGDVGEAFAAYEQPADPAELQSLMGLD